MMSNSAIPSSHVSMLLTLNYPLRFPSERLTRPEALKGLTLDPAYASFTSHLTGSLIPGKRADFVIFDKDIMRVAEGKILGTRVVATVVDGRIEYGGLR